MDTFGEWLREQRSLRRFTREEFAGRIGCSVSTLRKIETGERRPSAQIAELMANCLDVPSAERSTFVRVARGELRVDRIPETPAPAAPASLPVPRTNLPLLPTPLIGRQDEVGQLLRLLEDPQCRLLTLVGAGGIGKTRLAIETAARLQDSFSGVYFVSLAPVVSMSAAVANAANAVQFSFHGPSDPRAQFLNHLRQQHLLLIMDNVEHLLAGEPGQETVAELLAEIVRECAQVKLLVTSRESVRLQEEWVFELQGLPLPDSIQAEAGTQNTSVELFLQRARRAQVGFVPREADLPAILRACRMLEGNPLGIELAAAWVRTLSCDEIAREIEHGLDFLSATSRDLPARHRSMRAVFEHSWQLLTEEEQQVLLRLSMFHGGFRRDAAEQVAGATLPVLSALVTKSLVRRSSAGRYDLHELIGQFAASKHAEDPKQMGAARERHSLFYLGLLDRQGVRLQSHQQKEAVAELTTEMDNLRAAWDGSIAAGEFMRLYEVSDRLMYLFEMRNWFQEGENTFRRTAESLRASPKGSVPDAAHQVALHALLAHRGYFLFRLGRGAEAYGVLSESAGFLRTAGAVLATIYSHFYLGIDCWILGKFLQANECLQASRALAREHAARWYEAMACEMLGRVAVEQGEYGPARDHLGEALAIHRELGDPSMIAHTLSYLGRTLESLGEHKEAEVLLRESLALSRENGYRFATGLALDGLGRVAFARERHEEAGPLFAESANLFKEMGEIHRLSRVLSHQGLNSLALGQLAAAREDLNSALRLACEGGFIPSALAALAGLAALRIRQGAGRETLELVLFVSQHPASAGDTREAARRLQAEIEPAFDPQEIRAARERTAARPLEELVREALADG
jgi:predicted ATPase/DNA-binding XRE family transcriptional regulator/Flp pilus assembly protein TadD